MNETPKQKPLVDLLKPIIVGVDEGGEEWSLGECDGVDAVTDALTLWLSSFREKQETKLTFGDLSPIQTAARNKLIDEMLEGFYE